MQAKGLLILVGATALAVAAVKMVIPGESPADAGTQHGTLLPNLLERVNDVAEVAIQGAEETVTLRAQDGQWVLLERGGFPATFEKVQGAVMGIARLEIEEPKTAKPENHAALGVDDPTNEGSEAKRVELRNANGERIAAVVVGETKYRSGSQAVFIRKDGEDQVYLCEGNLDIQAEPSGWIEKEIIRVDRDRVDEIEIEHADGETVLIGRSGPESTTYEVQNLPEGRAERNAGVANSVGTALAYLSLDDVRPVDAVDFQTEPLARSTFRCADGMVLVAETARHDEKSWIKLSASYASPVEAVGPAAPAPAEPAESGEAEESEGTEPAEGESLDVTADAGPDPEAVRTEVDELNARHSGWAYAIPDYKVDVIARRMADLLADLESEMREDGIPADLPLSMEELLQDARASQAVEFEEPAEAVEAGHEGHDHGNEAGTGDSGGDGR